MLRLKKKKDREIKGKVITTGGWIRQQPHKVKTKLKIKLFFSV